MNALDLMAELAFWIDAAVCADEPNLRLLDPEGVELAGQLAAIANGNVQAWALIGTTHWLRYQIVPEGQDQAELHLAMASFARVYSADPRLVPEPLRKVYALQHTRSQDTGSPQSWAQTAMALLQDPHTSGDIEALDTAVALLQRSVY